MTQRMTSQRIKILHYLKNVHTHPTAEMIFQEVKKDLPAITLATVYRNLHLLAEQGTISQMEVNKEYRYDANTCYHQHGICDECGKIVDFHQEELSQHLLDNIKTEEFKPECVSITFTGLCKKCSEVNKK
jgi:Fur family transcriptional regulator, peroxide stress response regulator